MPRLLLILVGLLCVLWEGYGLTALVLGSEGLIGSHLTAYLQTRGVTVLEVRNRRHIDLRQPNALQVFDGTPIDVVFFLACEVGGSRFLEQTSAQQAILDNNLAMFSTVFPWLRSRPSTRFVYASSYLEHLRTAYGAVKRLGEQMTATFDGRGKSVRLWNVYGRETALGIKSHAVPDFVMGCMTRGVVASRTTCEEKRQFIHADDVAEALFHFVDPDQFALAPPVVDISSGEWTPMTAVAAAVSEVAQDLGFPPCPLTTVNTLASQRDHLDPDMSSAWHDAWRGGDDQGFISLHDGLKSVFLTIQAELASKEKKEL